MKFAGILKEGQRPYSVTRLYDTAEEARKAGRALWFTPRFEIVEVKEDPHDPEKCYEIMSYVAV